MLMMMMMMMMMMCVCVCVCVWTPIAVAVGVCSLRSFPVQSLFGEYVRVRASSLSQRCDLCTSTHFVMLTKTRWWPCTSVQSNLLAPLQTVYDDIEIAVVAAAGRSVLEELRAIQGLAYGIAIETFLSHCYEVRCDSVCMRVSWRVSSVLQELRAIHGLASGIDIETLLFLMAFTSGVRDGRLVDELTCRCVCSQQWDVSAGRQWFALSMRVTCERRSQLPTRHALPFHHTLVMRSYAHQRTYTYTHTHTHTHTPHKCTHLLVGAWDSRHALIPVYVA